MWCLRDLLFFFRCISWGRLHRGGEAILGVFSSARETITNSIYFWYTYLKKDDEIRERNTQELMFWITVMVRVMSPNFSHQKARYLVQKEIQSMEADRCLQRMIHLALREVCKMSWMSLLN